MTGDASPASGRFQVTATLREAAGEVLAHRVALLRAVVVPAAVMSVLSVTLPADERSTLLYYALRTGTWVLSALMAVSCHRIVLLGEDALPGDWGVYWGERETRFFVWTVLVFAAFCLVVGGVSMLVTFAVLIMRVGVPTVRELAWVWPLIAFMAMPGLYVMGRVSLILPATAIDQRLTLKAAWSLSREHGARVAATTMLPLVALMALAVLQGRYLPLPGNALTVVARGFVYSLLGVYQIAVLSVTYRGLVR